MKKAEKREGKPRGGMEGMLGMNAYQQHPGTHPGYGAGQYPQQGLLT